MAVRPNLTFVDCELKGAKLFGGNVDVHLHNTKVNGRDAVSEDLRVRDGAVATSQVTTDHYRRAVTVDATRGGALHKKLMEESALRGVAMGISHARGEEWTFELGSEEDDHNKIDGFVFPLARPYQRQSVQVTVLADLTGTLGRRGRLEGYDVSDLSRELLAAVCRKIEHARAEILCLYTPVCLGDAARVAIARTLLPAVPFAQVWFTSEGEPSFRLRHSRP